MTKLIINRRADHPFSIPKEYRKNILLKPVEHQFLNLLDHHATQLMNSIKRGTRLDGAINGLVYYACHALIRDLPATITPYGLSTTKPLSPVGFGTSLSMIFHNRAKCAIQRHDQADHNQDNIERKDIPKVKTREFANHRKKLPLTREHQATRKTEPFSETALSIALRAKEERDARFNQKRFKQTLKDINTRVPYAQKIASVIRIDHNPKYKSKLAAVRFEDWKKRKHASKLASQHQAQPEQTQSFGIG